MPTRSPSIADPVACRTVPARYRKLSSGGWGVAITGEYANDIEIGDRVNVLVERKNGTTSEATVVAVWRGQNFYGEGDAVLGRFVKADDTPPSDAGA
ncbi:MAG: hypothetical protein F4174_11265 [Acidobacteria bacterium]|nr:hypothetical protein [Acidobacteriota bacterium]